MSETSRIKLDPVKQSLNLERFNIGDSFGTYIDKLNRNFDEIVGNFGGPMGPNGPQGPPGCKGEAGPQGPPGESDLNWKSLQSRKCDSEAYNNEDGLDSIANRLTNRGLLLSNLAISDTGDFLSVDPFDEKLTSDKVSNYFAHYKLKLYNADRFGFGEHIHLMNTKAIEKDFRFMCESGFTISDDFDTPNINREVLRIVGRKHDNRLTCEYCGSEGGRNTAPVQYHIMDVEIISDLLILKHNFTSQSLEFDTGSAAVNPNKLRFTLDEQTKQNQVNIPDRTGYMAVWEDTNEHSENWEVITADQIVIYSASYLDADFASYVLTRDEIQWVGLDANSTIRFKRQNNWVIVDFHIEIIRKAEHDKFTLRNIKFLVDIPTIGCKTLGWHPSSVMENEDIAEDSTDTSAYGHFKIFPVDLGNNARSFVIGNKFPYNIYNLVFDSTDIQSAENYWLTGQVWATVCNDDCDLLTIEQCSICPSSMIVQNP